MTPTTYQKPEIRDSNDNIIQQGAFGKNTALSNATNDGWIDYVANDLEALKASADSSAPINSPAFTGTPTAPTQVASDDSTNIATTAFVHDNTDDKAPLASPSFTGTPTAPTQTASDDSTKIATTEFVHDNTDNKLPLTGGTITGSIYNNVGVIVRRRDDDGYTQINAGQDDNSSYLILYGRNSNGGVAHIRATNTTNTSRLTLFPDGRLLVNANYVLTSANYNNYALPLSGGTMTGEIVQSGGAVNWRRDTDDYFTLFTGASDYTKGACLALNGKDRTGYEGKFELLAKDGTNVKTLAGKPDGTLTWDGNNVMTNPIGGLGARQIRVFNNRQTGKFTISEPSGSWGFSAIASFSSPTSDAMNRIFICKGYWTGGASRTKYTRLIDVDDGAFAVAVEPNSDTITFTVTSIGRIIGTATILSEDPATPVTFTWTPE